MEPHRQRARPAPGSLMPRNLSPAAGALRVPARGRAPDRHAVVRRDGPNLRSPASSRWRTPAASIRRATAPRPQRRQRRCWPAHLYSYFTHGAHFASTSPAAARRGGGPAARGRAAHGSRRCARRRASKPGATAGAIERGELTPGSRRVRQPAAAFSPPVRATADFRAPRSRGSPPIRRRAPRSCAGRRASASVAGRGRRPGAASPKSPR
jgi:hypothetical protein